MTTSNTPSKEEVAKAQEWLRNRDDYEFDADGAPDFDVAELLASYAAEQGRERAADATLKGKELDDSHADQRAAESRLTSLREAARELLDAVARADNPRDMGIGREDEVCRKVATLLAEKKES